MEEKNIYSNLSNYAAVVSISIFTFALALNQIWCYDFWWHLATGKWILETGRIPLTDPFSWSSIGEPWAYTSWLSGVVFAALESLAGINGIIIFKAFLISMGFGGLAWYLIRKSVSPWIITAVLLFAVVVAQMRFLARPLLFMFPFAMVLFWMLDGPANRGKKTAFLLVPMTVFWFNLHGSGYLAPVFSSFLLCEKLFEWWRCRVNRTDHRFPFFMLTLTLLLFAAVMVTPYNGAKLLSMTFSRGIVDDLVLNSISIDEHLPLTWGVHQLYWTLMIATGFSFVADWRKIRIFHLLIFSGTSLLALGSIRYIGIAAMMQAPILAINLQVLLKKIKNMPRLKMKCGIEVAALLLLTIAGGTLGFKHISGSGNTVYIWGIGVNERVYPVRSIEFIRFFGVSGNIVNSWGAGGYILYNAPELKTFIDGRCLPAQLRLADKIVNGSGYEINKLLIENRVQAAIVNRQDLKIVSVLDISPRFVKAYVSKVYAVYLPIDFFSDPERISKMLNTKPPDAEHYSSIFMRLISGVPASVYVQQILEQKCASEEKKFTACYYLAHLLAQQDKQEALDYYEKALTVEEISHEEYLKPAIAGAELALRSGKPERAVAFARKGIAAKSNSEDNFQLLFLYGTGLYQTKEYRDAETILETALRIKPDNPGALMNLGYLYMDTGNLLKSHELISRAYSIRSEDESIAFGYALILQKTGSNGAKEAWESFISSFPDSNWLEAARKNLEIHRR